MPLLLLLLSFSLLDPSSFCNAQEGSLASDALALLAFINNLTIGSTSSRAQLSSWNPSSTSTICSSWFGVSCSTVSGRQRVSELHLPGKSLFGHIAPDTINHLDALSTLSLRSNKLYGIFPADFVSLSALRKLLLQKNDLSGSLPSDFSQWPLLSQLDLSSNSFSGPIPSSLNSLAHLKSLYLQNNLLSGALPPLERANSLAALNVANNNFSGSIPASLSRFPVSNFAGNKNLCGPPLAECGRKSRHKLSTGAIVGIAFGAAGVALLFLLLLLLLCILAIKRKKSGHRGAMPAGRSTERDTRGMDVPTAGIAFEEENRASSAAGTREGEERVDKLVFIDGKKLFDLEDLLRASAEVLGKGTLGTSYKAVLEDGLIVAVKRLRDIDEGRGEEYRRQVQAIGGLRHDNVVPLRAYYLDKEENLLVYDFMQNGSLYALLHGSRSVGINPLDWEVRVRIAETAARGLAAIHAHNMVHGNIKSSNVLLKSNLESCVADYGLSPLMQFTPGVVPKSVGYMAPEITNPRYITPEADVFSFGVLLLELLTGKVPLAPTYSTPRPSASSAPPEGIQPSTSAQGDDPVDLPRWVQSVVREEWTAEVFDPLLLHSDQAFNEEEMVDLLQVAMSCVSSSPDQRPSMPEVVRMIDNIRHNGEYDDKSSDSNLEHYNASTSKQR
ncbi:hypothetical protein L7F22_045925 [Adiantum nelumboides]|nr:hypothetical protein [Adiantum nelumboides]